MPAVVTRTALPPDSRLHALRAPGDFLDCYGTRSPLPAPQAAQIIATFPSWASALLRLRNALVAPFGLSTDLTPEQRKGTTAGPFPVEHSTEDEVILGLDDRHLNFRVAVISDGTDVHMATWVRPHHLGGRAYLAAVMPFPILICRNALARVAREGMTAGSTC